MSEEVYIVVFEYNEGVTYRGVSLSGHRFIETYKSKEEFEKKSYDNAKLIAVGVTEIEAERIKRRLDDIISLAVKKDIPKLVKDNSIRNE